MNIATKTPLRGKGRGPFPGVALAAAAGLALAACDFDRVLDVPDPDVVLPELTRSETALPSWRAATLGDFTAAYVGNPAASSGEGIILTSGLMADEFQHTGTFPTRAEVDNRSVRVENATMQDVFRRAQRARNLAEEADRVFAEFGPDQAGRSEVLSLAGYSYIMFGENYCPGVPFSDFDIQTGVITEDNYGHPLGTEEIFQRALERFESAAQVSGATGQLQQLAAVGAGRTLLNLGRFDEAASAVAGVDTDFSYLLFHSDNTTRQNNAVWSFNNSQGRWSVANRDGGTGLPYRERADEDDPRLAYTPITAFAFGVDAFGQLKYPTRADNTPLATGIEARLIEAEAALHNGRTGDFADIHNALRAGIGLEPLVVAGLSDDDLVEVHFEERAYWLWLTGQRLGDLRRMIRDYGRTEAEVFPNKPGNQVSFPVPVDEENNPHFDRTMCDPTIP